MDTYIETIKLKKTKSKYKRVQIKDAKSAADYVRQFYGSDIEIYESFFVLLLNQGSYTIGYAKISQGGTVGTVVDPKFVAKIALEGLAVGVILAHNHPAGTLKPSDADTNFTNKIQKGLKLFDINLIDHIILTTNGYYSFKSSELI